VHGGGTPSAGANASCRKRGALAIARPAPSNKFLPKSAIVRRPRTRVLCARVYADVRKKMKKKEEPKRKGERNEERINREGKSSR